MCHSLNFSNCPYTAPQLQLLHCPKIVTNFVDTIHYCCHYTIVIILPSSCSYYYCSYHYCHYTTIVVTLIPPHKSLGGSVTHWRYWSWEESGKHTGSYEDPWGSFWKEQRGCPRWETFNFLLPFVSLFYSFGS